MYATAEQLRALLGGSAPGSAADLPEPELNEHLTTASAQVDAALTGRYRVPLDPPPRLVLDITLAIAGWWATLTYRRSVDLTDTDPVSLRYRWAVDQLTALSTGTSDLPPTDEEPNGPESGGGGRATVINPYRGRLFGTDTFAINHEVRDRYRRGY